MDTASLLGALQLADPGLPIGRFAHSHGLEALLLDRDDADAEEIFELVESVVVEAAGPLEGAAAALAAGMTDVEHLLELDSAVTARRLTPGAREASFSCGRRLAALAPSLVASEPAVGFCQRVEDDLSDGNLPVVEGTVARGLGLDPGAAATLAVRGSATALLSAAVRLGRLSASEAQAWMRRLEPALVAAVDTALVTGPDDLRASIPELELYSLAHGRADARSFIT